MIRRLLLASLGAFFVIGSGEPALAADPEVWPPVAQSQWLDVDCGAAKLTTTASPPRCRGGPVFNDRGTAEHQGPIECTGEQWAVFTPSSASFGFARLAHQPPGPRTELLDSFRSHRDGSEEPVHARRVQSVGPFVRLG